MKTNSATLVFFSSPTLALGFCLRKMGGKALGRGCSLRSSLSFSSLLPFFFPSPSLMWFSTLSSNAKKLPFGPFPINWQAKFSKFVFKNPAGYKYITEEIPQVTQAQHAYWQQSKPCTTISYRDVFVMFSYYCQFLPHERHGSKF